MLVTDSGFDVDRNQIPLNAPIKIIGMHKVPVALHPEVEVTVIVTVARNADEAERSRAARTSPCAAPTTKSRGRAARECRRFFEPEAAEASRLRRGRKPPPRRARSRQSPYSSNGSSLGTETASTRASGGASGGGSDLATSGSLAWGAAGCALGRSLRALRGGRSWRPGGGTLGLFLVLVLRLWAFSLPARGSAGGCPQDSSAIAAASWAPGV